MMMEEDGLEKRESGQEKRRSLRRTGRLRNAAMGLAIKGRHGTKAGRYRPLRMTSDSFRGRSHCGTWSPRRACAAGPSHQYKRAQLSLPVNGGSERSSQHPEQLGALGACLARVGTAPGGPRYDDRITGGACSRSPRLDSHRQHQEPRAARRVMDVLDGISCWTWLEFRKRNRAVRGKTTAARLATLPACYLRCLGVLGVHKQGSTCLGRYLGSAVTWAATQLGTGRYVVPKLIMTLSTWQ